MEEAVGFEPTEPFSSRVFKTPAFGRSATLPYKYLHPAEGAVKKVGRRGGIRTPDPALMRGWH